MNRFSRCKIHSCVGEHEGRKWGDAGEGRNERRNDSRAEVRCKHNEERKRIASRPTDQMGLQHLYRDPSRQR